MYAEPMVTAAARGRGHRVRRLLALPAGPNAEGGSTMIGQTDIATFALVGIVLFAVGAILVYLTGQRK